MEALSPGHLVVIGVVAVVLFFGWRQLPDISRSLGRSLRIFKTEIKGTSDDVAATPDAPTVVAATVVTATPTPTRAADRP